jgi:Gentisate 1,2-dioxygenase
VVSTMTTSKDKPVHSPEEIKALRHAYYERLGQKNLAPLWEVLRAIVPNEPSTPFLPALWRFNDFKPMVFEGGELISAKEAERRCWCWKIPACAEIRHHAIALCRHPACTAG